jgi:two-component system nitrogen regulation sensor histidine kinase GlnL
MAYDAELILNSLPSPIITLDKDNMILSANSAAESFFQASSSHLKGYAIDYFLPFSSPLMSLIETVRISAIATFEYGVDLSSPRIGEDREVDIHVGPMSEYPENIVVMFRVRSLSDQLNKQLLHKGAARTVTGLASMLAHEIKNPLSGISGAAQLLEMSASKEDQELTQLIKEETNRIVALVDSMAVFSDDKPIEPDPVNIHGVLERVKQISEAGFAKGVKFIEKYDPSLPPVSANRDQLIQVVLNLVKNACEAFEEGKIDAPQITLTTAYKAGMKMRVVGGGKPLALPIEITIKDNGGGISEDRLPYIFDPFITSKVNGTGLGLALVAKIIDRHGGMIDCKSNDGKAEFRILLPRFVVSKMKSNEG